MDGHPRNSDIVTKELMHELGYDKLPIVLSNVDMNKIIELGNIELYRGVTDDNFAKQFKTGEYFVGHGIGTTGTYAAYGDNSLQEAEKYVGKNGSVIRMAINKDAKIITDTELIDMQQTAFDSEKAILESKLNKIRKEESDYGQLKNKIRAEEKRFDLIKEFISDAGQFAALNGYDAIDLVSSNHMIILNRSAIYVQQDLISKKQNSSYLEI